MSNYPDSGSQDPQPQAPLGGSSAAGSASAPGPDYSTPPPPPPGAGYSYSAPAPGVAAGGPPAEALAGFWIRLGAAFIDGIILGIVTGILAAIFGFGNGFGATTDSGAFNFFDGSRALQTLLGAIYFTYLHASATGQSLGNRVTGIRVVDADTGATIPYSRSLIRYLISLLSGAVLLIGYLWMLFDARKQTWHDKVANTLVVRSSYYPPSGQFGRPAAG